MNQTAQLRGPGARRGRLTTWVHRLQRALSDRLHADGDALAHAHGWTITATTGRFGSGGRTYHDPRFTARALTAQLSTPAGHAARPGRHPAGPAPGPIRPEGRNTDA
jgi:hypothetical protein